MARFTDAKGREWVIDIDPYLVQDVHNELQGLSLYTLTNDKMKPLQELLENSPLLCHAVYILVREQARAAGVDEREFARGCKGDGLEAMQIAFYNALAEFFPKKKRELMEMALEQTKGHLDSLHEKVKTKLTSFLSSKFGSLSELLDSAPGD